MKSCGRSSTKYVISQYMLVYTQAHHVQEFYWHTSAMKNSVQNFSLVFVWVQRLRTTRVGSQYFKLQLSWIFCCIFVTVFCEHILTIVESILTAYQESWQGQLDICSLCKRCLDCGIVQKFCERVQDIQYEKYYAYDYSYQFQKLQVIWFSSQLLYPQRTHVGTDRNRLTWQHILLNLHNISRLWGNYLSHWPDSR